MTLSAIPHLNQLFSDYFNQNTSKKEISSSSKLKHRSSLTLIINRAKKYDTIFFKMQENFNKFFLIYEILFDFVKQVCKQNYEVFCKLQKLFKIFQQIGEFFWEKYLHDPTFYVFSIKTYAKTKLFFSYANARKQNFFCKINC